MTCSKSYLMSKSITVNDFLTEAHDHSKGKVCNTCKEHLPLSEFCKHKRIKDGLNTICKSCKKEYDAKQCRFKTRFLGKKRNAEMKGIEFTIEPTDIPGVKIKEKITIDSVGRKHTSWEATEYPKVCPVLEMKLDWSMNGLQYNSPSLDRIDPTKGYIPGNVMMMSDIANRMKSNATPEQLKQFCRYYLFGE